MRPRALAVTVAALLAFPAGAVAQDPTWKVIRPNVTWDNHWTVEPQPQALFSVLDDRSTSKSGRSPWETGPPRLAPSSASRLASRTSSPGSSASSAVKSGSTSESRSGRGWTSHSARDVMGVWCSCRPRRQLTPPITLAPEDPPVGRNGFRGWLPLGLPSLARDGGQPPVARGADLSVFAEALAQPRLRRLRRALPEGT